MFLLINFGLLKPKQHIPSRCLGIGILGHERRQMDEPSAFLANFPRASFPLLAYVRLAGLIRDQSGADNLPLCFLYVVFSVPFAGCLQGDKCRSGLL